MIRCEVRTADDTAPKGRRRWRRCGRARAPLAALATLLILVFCLAGERPAAAASAPSDSVKIVALLGVQFLNDHEDLEPTSVAERARLASIEQLFKSELEA